MLIIINLIQPQGTGIQPHIQKHAYSVVRVSFGISFDYSGKLRYN